MSGFDRLHRWHDSGNVAMPMLSGKMTLRLSEASAIHWREWPEPLGR